MAEASVNDHVLAFSLYSCVLYMPGCIFFTDPRSTNGWLAHGVSVAAGASVLGSSLFVNDCRSHVVYAESGHDLLLSTVWYAARVFFV